MLQQLHAEKGVAKGLGLGRDRDEANVTLAQQCYGKVQQLIAATTLVCCIELHTVVLHLNLKDYDAKPCYKTEEVH